MVVGLSKNLAWCIIVIVMGVAVTVPPSTASKLTIKNDINGVKGRDRILSVRCWSKDDKLGLHEILPGQSKSWTFTSVDHWPLFYTEFRCKFRTAFGTTKEDDVIVYEGRFTFLDECYKPTREECLWVAKRDGLYLRSQVRWFKEYSYEDKLKSKWIWDWGAN